MGFLDAIKGLLGSAGVAELVESMGIADQVEGLTDAVQAPIEDLGTVAGDVTAAVDPLTGQL